MEPTVSAAKRNKKSRLLRALAAILILGMIIGGCGPKPYYKTHKGKKKQKYYNDIQFGGKSASEMKH